MNIIYNIFLTSQKQLHVMEIFARAKEDFNVDLDCESIVSALTKRVKIAWMFKRVKPNTFALLDSDSENNN